MKVKALILAAGKGSRMNSKIPKVLHLLSGKPFVVRVAEALQVSQIDEIGIVVSSQTEGGIREWLGNNFRYIPQQKQLGTGHAVMSASYWLEGYTGDLVVVVGDAPFITNKVISDLIDRHYKNKNICTLLSSIWEEPPPYGRIVRNKNGKLIKIVEEKDASEEEVQIKEVSSSHYCFSYPDLKKALMKIEKCNVQKEYYLSDVIEIFIAEGKAVEAIPVSDPIITAGINTAKEMVKFQSLANIKLEEQQKK